MRYQILFLFIISSFLISCGGNPSTTPNTANTPNTTAPKNTGNTLGANKTPEAPKTNEGATIAPIVQGYYEALKKKDEAGAKKYLSAAALKYYENEAKGEKKTWFVFVLEEVEPVGDKYEVRNEKIEGDKAVAEIKGGNLRDWAKIVFIKESGEWKFDSPLKTFQESEIKKNDMPSNKPR